MIRSYSIVMVFSFMGWRGRVDGSSVYEYLYFAIYYVKPQRNALIRELLVTWYSIYKGVYNKMGKIEKLIQIKTVVRKKEWVLFQKKNLFGLIQSSCGPGTQAIKKSH